jgi:hypothetical protein
MLTRDTGRVQLTAVLRFAIMTTNAKSLSVIACHETWSAETHEFPSP